jgi:uncharacterized protein (TIGR02246 family)
MIRACAAIVLGTAIVVGTAAAGDPRADEAAIRQRLTEWKDAFNDRNAAGACDLFAEDLVYALPEVPQGSRETMCGNLAAVLARPDLELRYDEPEIHEIILSGDIAVLRLTWTLTARVGETEETTREAGIDIFRRGVDGRWSIARFIAFTTRPNGLLP